MDKIWKNIVPGLHAKPFTSCSKNEHELILKWRNDDRIRNNMLSTGIITMEKHLSFVELLRVDDRKRYWLVYKKQIPIGVIYLIDIDYIKKKSDFGVYVDPNMIRSGQGTILMELLEVLAYNLGIRTLYSEVFSTSKNTVKFYENLGYEFNGCTIFTECGRRNFKYFCKEIAK